MPRMKFLTFLIAMILLFPTGPSNATDSDWKSFLKVKDRFYYLDRQEFNEISCMIDVPLMRNVIKQMNDQLAPVKENVEIRDDLSLFRLTFRPESGLSYSDPQFDITVKSMEGVADPERAKEGIRMMKMGFNQQVLGVKNILDGLFDDYQYPKREKYKNLAVTAGKDSLTAEYTHENRKTTESYSGNVIEIIQIGSSDKIESNQKYIPLADGKLIFNQGIASIRQPSGDMEVDISIDYQNIENIIFPEKIQTSFQQTIQSITQSGTIDINLIKCKLK